MNSKTIEEKGSIWIDVWDKGTTFNGHCGGVCVGLHEIFFDTKQNPRRPTTIHITDRSAENTKG